MSRGEGREIEKGKWGRIYGNGRSSDSGWWTHNAVCTIAFYTWNIYILLTNVPPINLILKNQDLRKEPVLDFGVKPYRIHSKHCITVLSSLPNEIIFPLRSKNNWAELKLKNNPIIAGMYSQHHSCWASSRSPNAQFILFKKKATEMSVLMLTAWVNLLCFDGVKKIHLKLVYKLFSETT